MKKKLKQSINYKKGVELTDKNELISVVNRSHVNYIKNQTIYTDGSQSMTVEIHFEPKG